MLIPTKQSFLIFFAAIGLAAMILIPTLSAPPATAGPIVSFI